MRIRVYVMSALLIGATATSLAACSPDVVTPPGSVSPTVVTTTSLEPSPSAEGTVSATSSPSVGPQDQDGGDDDTVPLDALPVITIAAVSGVNGNIIFGGYVSGVVESGGTCVFFLVDSSATKTIGAETVGEPNSDTTSCGSPEVPSQQVARGTYSVVLTYTNSQGSNSSAPVTLEVP